MVVLLSNNLVA